MVTYSLETLNKLVTDYDGLTLNCQSDKANFIYDQIKDSIPKINFYPNPSATTIKLKLTDRRLHIHVTEGPGYPTPPVEKLWHVGSVPQFRDSSIAIGNHISGWVYKAQHRNTGRNFVLKEIPSDAVDKFLYEIQALHKTRNSMGVIDLVGILVDNEGLSAKSILVEYAEGGLLNDWIHENGQPPSWEAHEKWARQIIRGLSNIHEAGFVQGDFTTLNIVLTGHGEDSNTKIININRCGCPGGWEPPEFEDLIASGQSLSMYIGDKSDIFQLGMVLWALVEWVDPGRKPRLTQTSKSWVDVPAQFKEAVNQCLSPNPRDRP